MAAGTIIDHLGAYGIKPTGKDRYRAICPVCGERNTSTLSVGVTNEGAVLLKCFKSECDIESIVAALGLEIIDLFPPRESHAGPTKRRRLLTAQQALDLLAHEARVILIIGADMRDNQAIDDTNFERLRTAIWRVQTLAAEVHE